MEPHEIDLDQDINRSVPDHARGKYTFVEAIPIASVAFVVNVSHMANGIGNDPGEVRPDVCLKTWLEEIDAATIEARIK